MIRAWQRAATITRAVNAALTVVVTCAASGVLAPMSALAADAPMPAKAQTCVACHGPNGNSPTPTTPSLAGQPKQFLATQMLMYREGNRKDPQMSPMVAGLSNADLNELAGWFSAQKLVRTGAPVAADKAAAMAKLSDQFNCTQCHGAALLGTQHIPRLAGQHAQYLTVQLKGFKTSTRFDMDGQMTSAAQALNATDIDALAEYLAGYGAP